MTTDQKPSLSPEDLQELAAAGGICDRCGQVHVLGMDQAIHMVALKDRTGIKLPWCTCSPCAECGPWKEKAEALAQQIIAEHGEPHR